MKQIKKLLVVLPLVLVFVLGSLPVFAEWPLPKREDSTNPGTFLDPVNSGVTVRTVDKEGTPLLSQSVTLTSENFKQKDHKGIAGTDPQKVLDTIIGMTVFKDDFKANKLKLRESSATVLAKFIADLDAKNDPPVVPSDIILELEEVVVKRDLRGIVAVDRLTLARVPATIHQIENKDNAKSVYDMAHEFFDWETAHGNALKDYYFLGFAPDVNNNVTDLEQEQLDKYKADILVWVVEKLQPLNVTHVFPDRAPLFEKIAVDYWVLEKGQINNANAAEFAKTRIQKMNEQGYVFEKAEYTPYIYRESIMKEALDVYGKKIQVDSVVSTHGIFVYYKGAVVPAPVADGEKKVDAASVQTGVQANVQAPVAAAGAQPQQLPATGVADNAFLFLSSAALMALGIFFFKKH